MQNLQDPKYIQLNKTEIYDYIFIQKIGIDLQNNYVYQGVNKFREHKAIKFIHVPQIIKLKYYLQEPLKFQGCNNQYILSINDFTVMSGFSSIMTVMDLCKVSLSQMIQNPYFTIDQRYNVIKQIGYGIKYMHIQKKSSINNLRPESILKTQQKQLNYVDAQRNSYKFRICPYILTKQFRQFAKQRRNSGYQNNQQAQKQLLKQWLYLYDAPQISHDANQASIYDPLGIGNMIPKHFQYNQTQALNQNNNQENNHNNFYNNTAESVIKNRNLNTYSTKSDIWAYGIIILQLMLGKRFQDILIELSVDVSPKLRQQQQFTNLLLKDFPQKINGHSNQLRQMLQIMLSCNPHKRISINQVIRLLQHNQIQISESSYIENNLFNNINISRLKYDKRGIEIKQCVECKDETKRECDDEAHQFNNMIYDTNFTYGPIKLKQDRFDRFLQSGDLWKNYDWEQIDRDYSQKYDDKYQKNKHNKELDYRDIIYTEKYEQNYQQMQLNGIYGSTANHKYNKQFNNNHEFIDYYLLITNQHNRQSQYLHSMYRPSQDNKNSKILNLRNMCISQYLPVSLFMSVPSIQCLYLSQNGLSSLNIFTPLFPQNSTLSNRFRFQNVKLLDLSNNQLNSIQGIQNFNKLQQLYLQNNDINLQHPQYCYQSDIVCVQQYQIYQKNTYVLSQLKQLKYLGLSNNRVKLHQINSNEDSLFYLLRQLCCLQVLDIRNNNIIEYNMNIQNLKQRYQAVCNKTMILIQ